ncbi:MAG: hydantoinase B/oxoprolinase family protein [Xanthomonadales bacterium]|nr:hydantoinase B/oxoprolinase family protein [Xanthomonadales bacterium]
MPGREEKPADGIALGLFASRVAAISEEMGGLLGRAAFSPNIRDRLDYSCALFDPRGRLLGQATHIPVHLGSMAFAMGDLVREFDWQAGDMVVFNDPFRGGTHLPDVTFVAPVFSNERCIGFCANRAHHADIGAESPGSMPLSRSLDEEGIVIPPTRVVRSGEPDREWFESFYRRLASPTSGQGDFAAQIAANRLGVRRLAELAGALGPGTFRTRSSELQAYAERLARAALAEIPAGRYRFTDHLDDDGFGGQDIPVCVALQAGEHGIEVDFEGTADAVAGNLNCPMSVTAAAVFYVFRCLMPAQIPACDGALRPIRIRAPEGCLVNARAPSAVAAGNVETSSRIVDAVCGALAQAVPGIMPAASQGTMNNLAMGSRREGWDYYETLAGGMGAGPDCHGRSVCHSHMTNTLNTPVEVVERHYPLRITRYTLRRDSGGAGRYRGGDGIVREYEFLADADLSILSERRRHAPWGLAGGSPGLPGRNLLDGEPLPAKVQMNVRAGQTLRIETPGGGGFGHA